VYLGVRRHAGTGHRIQRNYILKKMRNLKNIFLTLFAASLFYTAQGQINLCGDSISDFPIDKKLFHIRESLRKSGIDTIVIYSHWIYTKDLIGYGKVCWKKKGQSYLIFLSIKSENPTPIEPSVAIAKEYKTTDSLINFFFENNLDTIETNQDKWTEYDGRHFISISWSENEYCFVIPDSIVQSNPENKRVQWIKNFKSESAGVTFFRKGAYSVTWPTVSPKKDKSKKWKQ